MATQDGTARFAARFPHQKLASFFRQVQDLTVSSIGIGTYLGRMDDATDRAYTEAIRGALERGINFIDTSLNYRNQRSERCVGAAIRGVPRDEIVLCTKAGYLVEGAVPGGLPPQDIAGGMHSMAPAFLSDQLARSQKNLGVESIDVFYLHNPETQLSHVPATEFYERVGAAFQHLEKAAQRGDIRFYGMATWDGFRRQEGASEGLSLPRLAEIATEIAGERHRFRFVQLPFNLAMPEAFAIRKDGENVLEEAQRLGVSVIASASLLQARLSRGLPDELARKIPGTATDAQRSVQFTRSTPGISVALVGMSQVAHVAEIAALGNTPPLTKTQYFGLYKQD
jgi:aryl-alcohol dehydrogenase-like predicted oxidoreductase